MKKLTANKYPAKKAYRNHDIAKEYDAIRFTSLKGRWLNRLEKKSILRSLDELCENNGQVSGWLAADAPIGTGRIAELLLEKGIKVIGIDISLEMLLMAKQKFGSSILNGKLYLVVADIEKLPFKSDCIDIVTSVRLMGHLPDEIKTKILFELLRVSKTGIIVTFYIKSIRQAIKRLVKRINGNTSPWFPLKKRNVMKMIHDANAEIIKVEPVQSFISEGYSFSIRKRSS